MTDDPAALRASLQAAQDLLRIAPAFFGYLGERGEVTDCNELALHVISATRAEVIGTLFWEAPWWAPLPASAARVRSAVELALRGEQSQFDLEYSARSPGATEREVRWVGLTITPVHDGTRRVAATGIDITDRVRALDELAMSEARTREAQAQLELALLSGQMGTWHIDLQTQRVTTSAATAAIFGLTGVDDDIASFINENIHAGDRERVTRTWQHAATAGAPFVEEFRVLRADQEVRWVLARGATRLGPDGVPSSFSGVMGDITERKLHEAALLAERHNFEAIFQNSPAGMAMWRGPQHVFEMVNSEYQATFGDRPLVGKPLAEALPEVVEQGFPQLLTAVLETGEPFIGREVVARVARQVGGPVEERYYDVSFIRVDDASGAPHGVYNHAVDVTERVKAHRDLEASVRELEQERELRERFVAALSHDLRTPLSAARLSAELIVHKAEDPRQLAKATERIVNNIDRADGMIRDLLDASRIKAGEALPLEIEALDLREIAQTTLDDLSSIHGDRFVLTAPRAIRGHWDGTAVRRILENLGSNAAKYGKSGTPVTITLDASAHAAELQVHNEGTPIPADEQGTVFELFKRASSANATVKGWGIGLSLVAGLARAHGGEAAVRSAAGHGTTFTVRLPLDARVR